MCAGFAEELSTFLSTALWGEKKEIENMTTSVYNARSDRRFFLAALWQNTGRHNTLTVPCISTKAINSHYYAVQWRSYSLCQSFFFFRFNSFHQFLFDNIIYLDFTSPHETWHDCSPAWLIWTIRFESLGGQVPSCWRPLKWGRLKALFGQ